MKIRDASLHFLTFRARTAKEMRDYLLKREFTEEDVDQEIEALKEFGYLNDIEFAISFINASLEKKRGMQRIESELKYKGVSTFDIEDSIAAFEEEHDCDLREIQEKNAREIADKMLEDKQEGKEIDRKLLAKITRKLITQGYEPNMVYDIIGSYR